MYQWPSYITLQAIGRYQLYETESGALYRIDTVEATTWHWTGKLWRLMDEEPERPDEQQKEAS